MGRRGAERQITTENLRFFFPLRYFFFFFFDDNQKNNNDAHFFFFRFIKIIIKNSTSIEEEEEEEEEVTEARAAAAAAVATATRDLGTRKEKRGERFFFTPQTKNTHLKNSLRLFLFHSLFSTHHTCQRAFSPSLCIAHPSWSLLYNNNE